MTDNLNNNINNINPDPAQLPENQTNSDNTQNNLNLNTPYQSPNLSLSNSAGNIPHTRKVRTVFKKKSKSERLSPTRKLAIKSMVESNMSLTEIKNSENVAYQTIYNVINDPKLEILGNKQLDRLKSHIITKAYSNSYYAQSSVTKDKLENASFMQLMIGSKIAIEQARLLEEKSTSNIAIKTLNDAIHGEIQSLSDRIKSLDNQLYGA